MPASIPYIENLGPEKLLSVLENLHTFKATEKIDGSQLLFGLDSNGFYTSRETKGGNRIYSVDQYPVTYTTTYRRYAHLFLQENIEALKSAGLAEGDQLEVEVLYSNRPNVVPYNTEINRVVFLRKTQGNLDFSQFSKLMRSVLGSITLTVPYTPDGRTIEYKDQTANWSSHFVPEVGYNREVLEDILGSRVNYLKGYLNSSSSITGLSNLIAYKLPLNRKPAGCENWQQLKEQLKVNRKLFEVVFNSFRFEIKNLLLEFFVKGRTSRFGTADGWIEGVVLTDENTTVKIVDKDTFSNARVFVWAVRHELSDNSSCTVSFLRAVKILINGFLNSGNSYGQIASSLRYLVDYKKQELESRLDKYKKMKDSYFYDTGHKVVVYDSSINERTLEVFSSLFALLDSIESINENSNNLEELRGKLLEIGI